MRPQILTPLFAQVTSLPGIGPRLGKLVEKLAGPLVVDLLWHLPTGIVDRRNAPDVANANPGDVATLTVTVEEHVVPNNRRQPYRVWCSDETGRLCLTYFNGREDYLKTLLPVGDIRVISGRVELYQGERQMTHPDHVVPLDQRESILRVEPVYGLTAGLTQRPVQKAIAAGIERAPAMPEWQDAAWLARSKWSDWKTALATAHAPTSSEELAPLNRRAARQSARHFTRPASSTHAGRPQHRGRPEPAEEGARRAAVPADLEPDLRHRRNLGRYGQGGTHGAPVAG